MRVDPLSSGSILAQIRVVERLKGQDSVIESMNLTHTAL